MEHSGFKFKLILDIRRTPPTTYKCKHSKVVTVLSTLHNSVTICDKGRIKLETIEMYSHAKFEVDSLDQMAHLYMCSTKAGSRRWPLDVSNILNPAEIN